MKTSRFFSLRSTSLFVLCFQSANEQLRKIYCDPRCHHRKSKASICSIKEFLAMKRRKQSNESLRTRLFRFGNNKFKKTSRHDEVISTCDCDVTHDESDFEKTLNDSVIIIRLKNQIFIMLTVLRGSV